MWYVPVAIVGILSLVIGLITYTTYAISKKPALNATQATPNPLSTRITTTVISTPTLVPTSAATAFPNTPQGLYASVIQSTPQIVDPLNQQDANNWDITTPNGVGSCQFLNGTYDVVSVKAGDRQPCVMNNNAFQNFALQGQMSFVSGTGRCGLIARKQESPLMSYRFYYYTNGDYEFRGPEDTSGKLNQLIKRTPTSAPTQPVTLTLIAKNDAFYLYVNSQFVGSAKDATIASGAIGFVCQDLSSPTEAHFTNAKIWNL